MFVKPTKVWESISSPSHCLSEYWFIPHKQLHYETRWLAQPQAHIFMVYQSSWKESIFLLALHLTGLARVICFSLNYSPRDGGGRPGLFTDCSSPGSSVHGFLQARTLEWVAIPFSRESSQPKDCTGVWAFLVAQLVKYPPAMQETLDWFVGWEDLLEKGEPTHSSALGFPWWLRQHWILL